MLNYFNKTIWTKKHSKYFTLFLNYIFFLYDIADISTFPSVEQFCASPEIITTGDQMIFDLVRHLTNVNSSNPKRPRKRKQK